jgi:hypothetical protein
MSHRTASRLAALLLIFAMTAAALPGLPALAQSEPPGVAPHRAQSAPFAVPDIDPRPLLETAAAEKARMPATGALQPPSADKSRRGGLPAGAAPKLIATGETPPLPERPKQLAGAFAGCTQLLINPTLDSGAGWSQVLPEVLVDASDFTTAPNAFRLTENNIADGLFYGLPADVDSFAQLFYFPDTAEAVAIDFNARYHSRGTPSNGGSFISDPHDEVWFEFYLYDPVTGGFLLNGNTYSAPIIPAGGTDWFSVSGSLSSNGDAAQQAAITAMQGQFVWVVISLVGDADISPAADQIDVSIDDVSLQACQDPNIPNGVVNGAISLGNALPDPNLSGALVTLTYTPLNGALQTVDVAYANNLGQYAFDRVADPGDGVYQVWFLNNGVNDEMIAYWAGARFTSENYNAPEINVTNVDLTDPESFAEVDFPRTFEWSARPGSGNRYFLCTYALDNLNAVGCTDALTTLQHTVTSASNTGLKDSLGNPFPLQLNKDYVWYVVPVGPGYDGLKDYGFSYYTSGVTFVGDVRDLPTTPVTPDPSPLPSAPQKPWTMMVYMAGDSNLGDAVECPGCNPPRGPFLQSHYNTLKRVARDFPLVNIVVLKDFFGNTGTQFCHLRSDGAEDCRELGEKDTSNPTTLSDFIDSALDRFPADRTMLVISDHGHAITGMAVDETTGRLQGLTAPEDISLTPAEVRSALSTGLQGRRLDILYYNVCLLGSFEAAYDASAFADYMVASADILWVIDVYERVLPLLNATNATRDVAAGIAQAYDNTAAVRARGLFVSVAAYDLSKVAAVSNRLSQFAVALSDNLNANRSAINTSRAALQAFDATGDLRHGSDDVFVDMLHMANTFSAPSFPSAAIRSSAAALRDEINGSGLIVRNIQRSGGNGDGVTINLGNAASGISVLFPASVANGPSTSLTRAYLTSSGRYANYFASTEWDEFVSLYSGIDSGAVSTDGRNRPARGGWRPASGAFNSLSYVFMPRTSR